MLRTYPISRKELEGVVERCLMYARVTDDSVRECVNEFVHTAESVAFGVSYDRPDCRCPLTGAYDVKTLSDVPGVEDNNDGPLITFARLFDMCGYARTGVTFGELVVTDG
jgi:hypothetical protein